MKIEPDIPVPEKRRYTRVAETIAAMRPGDSVLLDDEWAAGNFSKAIRARGMQSTMRKTEGGWRVWRLADNPAGTKHFG